MSILLLIFRPNLVRLLLGWDGLGVTSFLLVIYFQRAKSANAGILTVLTNRVGDVIILLAIANVRQAGHWSIFFNAEIFNWKISVLLLLMLIIAAFTKRAQIPFSAWLPAAMAAPTPVSSLVHSSTLVTAGVYLLIRLRETLCNSFLQIFILWAGTLTILMAGLTALFEMDIKKIVALSTLSQLGLMVRSIGLGLWKIAFAHLLAHAFFKALLFIAVGNMIHLRRRYQDLRKANISPQSLFTLRFVIIANLSLCGVPFLSGFFSKDLILESLLRSLRNCVITVFFYLAVVLTRAYSARFTFMCWLSTKRRASIWREWDNDFIVVIACILLWPLALTGGGLIVSRISQNFSHFSLSLVSKNLAFTSVIFGGLTGLVLRHINLSKPRPAILWSWGFIWASPSLFRPFLGLKRLKISSFTRKLDLRWLNFITITTVANTTHFTVFENFWRRKITINAFFVLTIALMGLVFV